MPQPNFSSGLQPEAVIHQELRPGESLVWAGKPRGGVRLSPADTAMLPFRIIWSGAALSAGYILTRVAGTAASPFFTLSFALLFLLFGFYTLVGRLLVDALRRRNTIYGLTSHRLIVASGVFRRGVRSFDLGKLPPLWIVERKDGSGTIGAGTPPRGSARRVSRPASKPSFPAWSTSRTPAAYLNEFSKPGTPRESCQG